MADSPFIRDVPAARALAAWRDACEAAGCPARIPATRVPVRGRRPGHRRAGLGRPLVAALRRGRHGRDRGAGRGYPRRERDHPGLAARGRLRRGGHRGPDPRRAGRGGDARARPLPEGCRGDTRGRAALPARPVDRRGRERGRVAAARRPPAAGRRPRGRRRGGRHAPARPAPPGGHHPANRGRGSAHRGGDRRRGDHRHQLADARDPGPRGGLRGGFLPIEPDDPERIAGAVKAAVTGCDLLIIVAGSSAGRDDYTARVVAQARTLAVHGVAVRPGHPVVLGAVGGTPVLGAPGYPVSAALTFDIFAEPLLAELMGAPPRRRPRATAPRLARKLASPLGLDNWVRVRLGVVRGAMVATPLPRGAKVVTSLVRADGLLVVPAGLEGHHAGEEVDIELLRGIDEIAGTIVAIGEADQDRFPHQQRRPLHPAVPRFQRGGAVEGIGSRGLHDLRRRDPRGRGHRRREQLHRQPPGRVTFFKQARRRGTTIICIDPGRQDDRRRRHLPPAQAGYRRGLLQRRPPRDLRLDLVDHDYTARRTTNFEALAKTVLTRSSPDDGLSISPGCPPTSSSGRPRWGRPPARSGLRGMGISQHTTGTDNARCLI